MARLAVADGPGLTVSTIEGEREGPSYTFETVRALAAAEPAVSWELLAGADMIADMPRWYRAKELVDAVQVVGFGRPGADATAARGVFAAAFGAAALVWVDVEPFPASSSGIRAALARGDDPSELLSPAVFTYVLSKQLYGG